VINQGVNLTKDGANREVVVEPSPTNSPASKSWQSGIAIAFACIGLVVAIAFWLIRPPLDPYTQSVLGLAGDATQGRSIFVMNCVACHGQWATGKVGPNLHGVSDRKSDARLIHQVVSGETPPMPQFQPTPQDMADLLSYLKKL
jgi:mono/diheme cytochrome c family protein